MDLPFNAFPGAGYISALSEDIIPTKIREAQRKMNVPGLSVIGCRFLNLCVMLANPSSILDIGCGIGASTTAMHLGAPNARIDALDGNIDRVNACRELLADQPNTHMHHCLADEFLISANGMYDFAFVDTIKKDYMAVWTALKKILLPGATVVFDDVLLYGYVTEEEATTPMRYRDGRSELRLFLEEMSHDTSIRSQIIPIGGGMLLLKLL